MSHGTRNSFVLDRLTVLLALAAELMVQLVMVSQILYPQYVMQPQSKMHHCDQNPNIIKTESCLAFGVIQMFRCFGKRIFANLYSIVQVLASKSFDNSDRFGSVRRNVDGCIGIELVGATDGILRHEFEVQVPCQGVSMLNMNG